MLVFNRYFAFAVCDLRVFMLCSVHVRLRKRFANGLPVQEHLGRRRCNSSESAAVARMFTEKNIGR